MLFRSPLLQLQQTSFIPSLDEFMYEGRGGGESHAQPFLTGGKTQPQGYMGLAGTAVAQGDDVLPPVYVLTAGQLQHQGLVQGGKGQEVETVQALYGGEAGLLDAPFHHALLPLDDL